MGLHTEHRRNWAKGQADERQVNYEDSILGGVSSVGHMNPRRVTGGRGIQEADFPPHFCSPQYCSRALAFRLIAVKSPDTDWAPTMCKAGSCKEKQDKT